MSEAVQLALTVRIRPGEQDGFVAVCEELGTMTSGASIDDVKDAANDMIREYFLACADLGTLGAVLSQLTGDAHEGPVAPVVPPEDTAAPEGAPEVRWRTHYSFEEEQRI